jgi:hypothetical protein
MSTTLEPTPVKALPVNIGLEPEGTIELFASLSLQTAIPSVSGMTICLSVLMSRTALGLRI